MEMEFVVHCVSLAFFVFTGAALVLCHEGGEAQSDGSSFAEADEQSAIVAD